LINSICLVGWLVGWFGLTPSTPLARLGTVQVFLLGSVYLVPVCYFFAFFIDQLSNTGKLYVVVIVLFSVLQGESANLFSNPHAVSLWLTKTLLIDIPAEVSMA
jgi:hypothetical protein